MKKLIIILFLFCSYLSFSQGEEGRAIKGSIQIDVGKIDTLYFNNDTLYLTEDGRLFKTEIITSGGDGYVSSLTWTDGTNILTANDPVNGAKTATITGFVEDGDFSHDWDFSADDFTLRTVTDGGVIRFRNDPDGSSLSTRSATSNYVYFKLEGDADSPGNSKYYGTNASGTKGFHDVLSSAYTWSAYAGTTSKTISSGDEVRFRPDITNSSIETDITESTGIKNVFFKLTNDATTPGNSKYYGTNSGGTKGWYDLPSGSGVSFGASGQIPYTNATTNDFNYTSSFNYDGSNLNFTGTDFNVNARIDGVNADFSSTVLIGNPTKIKLFGSNGYVEAIGFVGAEQSSFTYSIDGGSYWVNSSDHLPYFTTSTDSEYSIDVTTTSDFWKKKEFRPIHDPLAKILSLNTYAFNWKEEAPKKAPNDKIHIDVKDDNLSREATGVIAQEIEKIMPEVVKTMPSTGYKAVDYRLIVPYLIEAIKEQQKQIENLQKQIDGLN